jgi:pimeloyl-ACP methyl ester carboxylesterase
MPRRPLHLPFLLLVGALLATGCVSLQPYSEVVDSLPAANFITVQPDASHVAEVVEVVEITAGIFGRTPAADSGRPRRLPQRVYVEQAGSGEPLILLHGFGGSSYSWREVMPRLAEHYRVLAPDLSGFGFTERPDDLEAYTLEGQVALVLALMDHFEITSAHFLAHSYGGSLSLALAALHPQRVRSLVLLDAAPPEYPYRRRKTIVASRLAASLFVRGIGLHRPMLRRALRRSFYDNSLVTRGLLEAYRERLAIEGAVVAYQGLTAPLADVPEPVDLATIAQPTLALWGAEDALIPVEVARAAVAKMPNARFEEIAASGHSPMEEQPDEVVRRVLAFLAELDGDL